MDYLYILFCEQLFNIYCVHHVEVEWVDYWSPDFLREIGLLDYLKISNDIELCWKESAIAEQNNSEHNVDKIQCCQTPALEWKNLEIINVMKIYQMCG